MQAQSIATAAFFTDGLLDAEVEGGRGGYRGVWAAMAELGPSEDAQVLVRRVAGDAKAADDIAAVLLRVGDDAPAAGAGGERRIEELELSARELGGERPGLFLRDCAIPTDRIEPMVEDLREDGGRLGGAVLRVRVGPGVPEAETALRTMDVLHVPSAAQR